MIETPLLTVDCILFDNDSVLLIKRGNSPFKGYMALPGGFVDHGETVEEACVRELFEETHVRVEVDSLTLLGVYSKVGRDPRGSTVSITFFAQSPDDCEILSGDDAVEAYFVSDWEKINLAFDHRKIIQDFFKLKNQ